MIPVKQGVCVREHAPPARDNTMLAWINETTHIMFMNAIEWAISYALNSFAIVELYQHL
jgi:hypothetical protein